VNDDARTARSILACPDEVELVVDGVPHPLDGASLSLSDWSGTPVFVCASGCSLSRAGTQRRNALMAVTSSSVEGACLVLAGQLRRAGVNACTCADGAHDLVAVDLSRVLLTRGEQRLAIDLEEFENPTLQLNAGFLRRSEQHINLDHGDHLRHAVAQRLGLRPPEVGGAQLRRLTVLGAELHWVTDEGGASTTLRFPRAARDADELGAYLREVLHPSLC